MPNKLTTDIIYLESPLQMLSAIEYCEEYNVKPIAIINFGDKKRIKNREQMIQLLEKVPAIKMLEYKHFNNPTIRDIYTFCFMFKLKKLPKANRFLIGDFRSIAACNLYLANNSNERVYIDDGAATIPMQLESIKHGIYSPILKSNRKKLFQKIYNLTFDINYKNLSQPNIYSIFYGHDFLIESQLNLRKKKATVRKDTLDSICFFFGSKYSESKIISIEDEISTLCSIMNYYSNKSIDFYYIPHRDESEEKLFKLINLGVQIKHLNAPAEVYFEEAQSIPAHISACWSTVLYSVGKKYNLKSVTSFDVLDKIKKHEARQRAQTVYDFYEKCDIARIKI